MNDSTVCGCGHVAAAHVVEASALNPARRYGRCGVGGCTCQGFHIVFITAEISKARIQRLADEVLKKEDP